MSHLRIDDLAIAYSTRYGDVHALDGVTATFGRGERVGIIGESGSGKSTLGMSLGRLLAPNARRIGGRVLLDDRDIWTLGSAQLRSVRRNELAYVFQDPVASLDPTKRVVSELRALLDDPSEAQLRDLLERVELRDPQRVLRSFPHELSGGMGQRVAIAMAIARAPRVIVADEPTASLDAVVRKRILELLFELPASTGAALLLLTHDLAAVHRFCERVVVMYGGRIVEDGPHDVVFGDPAHPYTRALARAIPGAERDHALLEPIPGSPPILTRARGGCAFAARCGLALDVCAQRPAERLVRGREVACHRAEEVVGA